MGNSSITSARGYEYSYSGYRYGCTPQVSPGQT